MDPNAVAQFCRSEQMSLPFQEPHRILRRRSVWLVTAAIPDAEKIEGALLRSASRGSSPSFLDARSGASRIAVDDPIILKVPGRTGATVFVPERVPKAEHAPLLHAIEATVRLRSSTSGAPAAYDLLFGRFHGGRLRRSLPILHRSRLEQALERLRWAPLVSDPRASRRLCGDVLRNLGVDAAPLVSASVERLWVAAALSSEPGAASDVLVAQACVRAARYFTAGGYHRAAAGIERIQRRVRMRVGRQPDLFGFMERSPQLDLHLGLGASFRRCTAMELTYDASAVDQSGSGQKSDPKRIPAGRLQLPEDALIAWAAACRGPTWIPKVRLEPRSGPNAAGASLTVALTSELVALLGGSWHTGPMSEEGAQGWRVIPNSRGRTFEPSSAPIEPGRAAQFLVPRASRRIADLSLTLLTPGRPSTTIRVPISLQSMN